jgi:hypothetical protein
MNDLREPASLLGHHTSMELRELQSGLRRLLATAASTAVITLRFSRGARHHLIRPISAAEQTAHSETAAGSPAFRRLWASSIHKAAISVRGPHCPPESRRFRPRGLLAWAVRRCTPCQLLLERGRHLTPRGVPVERWGESGFEVPVRNNDP